MYVHTHTTSCARSRHLIAILSISIDYLASEKWCRENQNVHFISGTFSQKLCNLRFEYNTVAPRIRFACRVIPAVVQMYTLMCGVSNENGEIYVQ